MFFDKRGEHFSGQLVVRDSSRQVYKASHNKYQNLFIGTEKDETEPKVFEKNHILLYRVE